MDAVDQKGKLYLGMQHDLKGGDANDTPLMYDVRHLTTHAVILGMTGSGKTGLGIIMLEEALLQGIPVLILDPKGDIANLMLTFPDLAPSDFEPWVDPEGARQRGMTVAEYAAQEAEKWRKGLEGSGITAERIARLRNAAEFTIFTPGSNAGQPVNVLNFFDTPHADWDDHEESLRERIAGIVSALLGLVGIQADPLQSPEHILLSRIIEHVWRAEQHLDLPTLIRLLQNPPFNQVGVFELDAFYPEKNRTGLARSLNNLIAAPGFETWQQGTPLEATTLMRAGNGKPRASVFYLAHLNDAQRMFFATLFFEAMRDWLRVQSGTTDLRALIYFDEVFGYFPPYPVNPPSKTPLLALIKQGRAAGLGVVLSTQNPADLDYKGLTNAGTWAVGTLRAERDKARVMEGLAGAISEAGASMDQRTVDQALGSLRSRVFLFHDINAGNPLFFRTRWAMSYLRGPLTRKQVRELSDGQPIPAAAGASRQEVVAAEGAVAMAASGAAPASSPAGNAPLGLASTPPALASDVPQVFLPPTVTFEWALRGYEERTSESMLVTGKHVVYSPHVLALASVRTLDRKRGVDNVERVVRLLEPRDQMVVIDWSAGVAQVDDSELSPRPSGEGQYESVPSSVSSARELKQLERDFSDYLYHNVSTSIPFNAALDVYGVVGESQRDFRKRCEDAARTLRDGDLQKARASHDRKLDQLRDKLRREQQELAADQAELDARKRDEVLSLGESAFRLISGRRASTAVSKASTKRRMTARAKAEVEESLATIKELEKQIEEFEQTWQDQENQITESWNEKIDQVDTVQITPRRADVMVQFCGLAWVPFWRLTLQDGRVLTLPARDEPA